MNIKTTLLGAIAYTLVTFTLGLVWHVTVLKQAYHTFEYFQGGTDFQLGLLTTVLQGLTLSFLYPYVKFPGGFLKRGLKFSMVIGLFFWTSHVLALITKQSIEDAPAFIAMESLYLFVQFGAYGILIGLIYKSAR